VPVTAASQRAARVDPRRRPVRLAFVGRAVEHAWSALSAPAGGVEPAWVEFREDGDPGDLLARLRDAAPDVVVAFAPERLPAGVLREVDAVTVGLLPDPLRLSQGAADVWTGEGLKEALAAEDALGHLAGLPIGDLDRLIVADPLLGRGLEELPVWRSAPLPVDDALFAPPDDRPRRLHPLSLDESTEHRESYLINAKHFHELSHFAFGLAGERLREVLGSAGIGVVLHASQLRTFAPRAPLHLAAGHLLVCEPLVPPRGLEPGLDHLVVEAPDQLMRVLDQAALRPAAFERVRVRGRLKAEAFRASLVWPRLLGDLADDLAAFGD
jgi:hypothetical protein